MPKVARKGSPITANWTFRYRRMRGKRRLVKVRKVGGREQVGMAGVAVVTPFGVD